MKVGYKPDCIFFDYGETCPTVYGAFCTVGKNATCRFNCTNCKKFFNGARYTQGGQMNWRERFCQWWRDMGDEAKWATVDLWGGFWFGVGVCLGGLAIMGIYKWIMACP